KILYARDDKHRDEILKKEFHGNAKVEVSRFKGLGEMMAAQLKETTMDPRKRTLLRVMLIADDRKDTERSVERLMGTKPEARFAFIQEGAEFADEAALDVKRAGLPTGQGTAGSACIIAGFLVIGGEPPVDAAVLGTAIDWLAVPATPNMSQG